MAGRVAAIVLAIVLATLLSAIYSVELLVPRWRVHRDQPAPVTLHMPATTEVVSRAGTTDDAGAQHADVRWSARQPVVVRGTVPTGELGDLAESYERFRRPIHLQATLGLFAAYFLISYLLFTYLRHFGSNRGRLLRTQIGVCGLVVLLMASGKAMMLFTPMSEFFIPASTVPLWIALHIDRRGALLVNLVLAFLVASLLRFEPGFIVVLLARGMASTLLFRDRKHPRAMVSAGLIGGIAGALMLIASRYYLSGSFDFRAEIAARYYGSITGCVAGGALAGVLGWVLHEPVGLLLGSVSRSQLVDLSDLEHPLLKKMAAEAPGSWQHSRAMANLAEDAAASIGADAMLTRTGAYYHDLGKTIQSQYFVENLAPGERSPHEDLEPDVSADAIMAHVVGGVRILRDAGIPEPVIEFAYTHHGTSVIEYFWHKCVSQGNPKGLSQDQFRYPGMKPQTRETAILMLIDAIEAASRTIDPPDRDKFEEMIQRVIFSKLKQGQLDESGLTVDDLRVLVVSIAERLVNVYHHRIKYPWQKQSQSERAPEPARAEPVAASAPEAPAASPAAANVESTEGAHGVVAITSTSALVPVSDAAPQETPAQSTAAGTAGAAPRGEGSASAGTPGESRGE